MKSPNFRLTTGSCIGRPARGGCATLNEDGYRIIANQFIQLINLEIVGRGEFGGLSTQIEPIEGDLADC